MIANFPDGFKTVRIFPDDCQFSGRFQKYPDFSRILSIFRTVSKMPWFFRIIANFPDGFKTVRMFPDAKPVWPNDLKHIVVAVKHTAPESVKRVKSSAQILDKSLSGGWAPQMHLEVAPVIRGLHCWTPVKNGVHWWPELPPSAFVAFHLQKNDLTTIFVRFF